MMKLPPRLQLLPVPPAQGFVWLRRGFMLYFQRPLAFGSMYLLFLLWAALVYGLPWVGAPLMFISLPLLSLGFMIASRSALRRGPVSPLQFIEPLRRDASRRHALIVLCLLYAAATVLVLTLSDWIDGGKVDALQNEIMRSNGDPALVEVDAALLWGLLLRVGLLTLLALPFWHAPALIWWGAQGPAQSLFSSALGCWRTRGALLVYSVAWTGLMIGLAILAAVLFALLGAHQLAGLAALPMALIITTVFYVSLYFMFSDTFGIDTPPPDVGAPPVASTPPPAPDVLAKPGATRPDAPTEPSREDDARKAN